MLDCGRHAAARASSHGAITGGERGSCRNNGGARSEIYHRLRDLAATGVGILMISSDLPGVLGLSDRVLVMRNGRLVREFTAAEAIEEKIIATATGAGMNGKHAQTHYRPSRVSGPRDKFTMSIRLKTSSTPYLHP